jgi:hypothetical protein
MPHITAHTERLVHAVREDRTVVAGPVVGVPYRAMLLDEPKPGTLIVW